MNDVRMFFVCILILLFTTVTFASAEKDFNHGVSFFKDQKYASAVSKFESAQQQGLSSIALFYNLASSYYKLGHYSLSKQYFKKVAQSSSMRVLAEYNMGLIALKENDRKKANQYFNAVVSSGVDVKLIRLAKKQLSVTYKEKSVVDVYLSSNIGYGDNIDSAPDGTVSGKSDSFYDVFMSGETVISGQRKAGWLMGASLFKLDYFNSNNYDEYQYSLGLKKAQSLADWETSLAVNFSENNYAGDDYISTLKLEAKGQKYLSKQKQLYVSYQYANVSSQNNRYDYLDGWRQRVKLEYRDYGRDYTKQLYYELEANDRGLLIGMTDRYDYSPTRHGLRGQLTRIVNKSWRLLGDLSYRFSDYPTSDSADRDDERWVLAVSTDYRVNKNYKLLTKLQYFDNSSTVDRYKYDRTLVYVGFSVVF